MSLIVLSIDVGADRVRDLFADKTIALAKRSYRKMILLMSTPGPKRLTDIRDDFERGVFLVLYNSRRQRLHRVLARVILGIKHGLRGILFSWPLYLLPVAAWLLQARYLPLILLLLLPGIYISGTILRRGVHEDYARLVEGCILRAGYPGRLLLPDNYQQEK